VACWCDGGCAGGRARAEGPEGPARAVGRTEGELLVPPPPAQQRARGARGTLLWGGMCVTSEGAALADGRPGKGAQVGGACCTCRSVRATRAEAGGVLRRDGTCGAVPACDFMYRGPSQRGTAAPLSPTRAGAGSRWRSLPSREPATRAPLSHASTFERIQSKNQENGQTENFDFVVIDRILTAMVTESDNAYQPAVARASGQEEADLLYFIASVKRQLPGQSTGEAFQKLTLVAASQIECKAKRPQRDSGMEGHDFSMHHDSPITFMTERCTSCDLERLVTRCGSKRSCQHCESP
jgi:hypothetical protein